MPPKNRATFGPHGRCRQWTFWILCFSALLASAAGCGSNGGLPKPDYASQDLLGYVVADEPRAAEAARTILQQGGNAADAGVALGLALTVTLPSRASLGGGGACLLRGGRPDTPAVSFGAPSALPSPGPPQAITFLPRPARPDSKIGLPMLARGLSLIQARFGRLHWAQLVAPAETMARFGTPVGRTFIADIAAAHAEISGPDGKPLAEGDWLPQGELGESLAALRSRGPGDLAEGELAKLYVAAAQDSFDAEALRLARPEAAPAESVAFGNETAYFSASSGGRLAASLWRQAKATPFSERVLDRLGWHLGVGDAASQSEARWQALADAAKHDSAAAAPGASSDAPSVTSFIVVDRDGGTIACSLGMGRLFGAGRIIPGTGIIASLPVPGTAADPMAGAASIVTNEYTAKLLAAFTGSGGTAGPLAMVGTALDMLSSPMDPEQAMRAPGRGVQEARRGGGRGAAGAVLCPAGLPAEAPECRALSDPRSPGAGLIVRKEKQAERKGA